MDCKLVTPNRKPSQKVEAWSEVKHDAKRMLKRLEQGNFPGMWKEGLAMSHCQINNESPLAFFVVHKNIQKAFDGFSTFVNPRIIDKSMETMPFKEACLSYPHRAVRVVFEAEVHNPLKVLGSGLSTRRFEVEGVAAFIVQHETGHMRGQDIYH